MTSLTDPRSLKSTSTVNGFGDVTMLRSPDTGASAYTFDTAGNRLTALDARGKKSSYSYDALNRLTRIAYASGAATVFKYGGGATPVQNAIGKLSGFTDESGSTSLTYNGFGKVLERTSVVGSGVVARTYRIDLGYGTFAELTGKQVWMTYPSGNRLVYSYGLDGALMGISLLPALADGSTGTMSVALLQEIRYAPFGAATGWSWGNSNTDAPNTYQRTVDLDGRITTYTLGPEGPLRLLRTAGGTVNYLYNALEQRVRKTGPVALVPTGTTDYVYDEAGRLIGEYDGNGLVQEIVYLGDMPVVVLKRDAASEMQVHYIFADHLNTPKMITRASDNKLVWRWMSNDPFGAAVPVEDPSGLGSFVYNLRFPGQIYDRESGLHYNHHRDYDPHTGRYIQSDPIGLAGGINTYGYVDGNPVTRQDALGLCPMCVPLIIAGGRGLYVAYRAYQTAKAVANISRAVNSAGRPAVAASCEVEANSREKDAAGSPHINPKDLGGQTPEEIEKFAGDKGLQPEGPDPKGGRGAFVDPVTGEQRVLVHPGGPCPHCHVNNPQGKRLDINGNVVAPESPAAHLPLGRR